MEPESIKEVAEYELSPGSLTPRWTRLVIESENGVLWVASCNFHPEIAALTKPASEATIKMFHRADGTGPYIQLEQARLLGGLAAEICRAIELMLESARSAGA
jgi:hypothetical protein